MTGVLQSMTVFGFLFSTVFLFWSTGLAAGLDDCNLVAQKDKRKANVFLAKVEVGKTIKDDQLKHVHMTGLVFPKTTMKSSTYSCSRTLDVTHPSFTLYAWLTELGADAIWEFVSIPHAVRTAVKQSDGALTFSRGRLLDHKKQMFVELDTTVGFVAEQGNLLFGNDWWGRVDAIVSAAFWKTTDTGPAAIGFLKVGGNARGGAPEVKQRYRPFSAKHILCAGRDSGIELLSPTPQMKEEGRRSEQMEELAQGCGSAIQAGPAYFEGRREGDKEQNRPGIGALSRKAERRNILFRTRTNEGSNRTFLWTSVGTVTAFDAMVAIEKVADDLVGKDSVLWAVGLLDHEFMSGPLLFGKNRKPLALARTDHPTGAVLVIYDAVKRAE